MKLPKHLRPVLIMSLLAPAVAASQSMPTGFSRACQYTKLSTSIQLAYQAISGQKVYGIPIADLHPDTKANLWAVESITADYGQFRYWLLAIAGQYRDGSYDTAFSSQWNSVSLYDNNRGQLTSVRAGHNLDFPNQSTWGIFDLKSGGTYQTMGFHYYWNRDMGQYAYIGMSRATTCNCLEWGLNISAPAVLWGLTACVNQ